MGFVEITKTGRGRGSNRAHATFARADKKQSATLRINSSGLTFMSEHGISLKIDDTVRVYHDPETGRLALKKDKTAPFRVAKNSSKNDTLRVTSKDLMSLSEEPVNYRMEKSEEYEVILVPLDGDRM